MGADTEIMNENKIQNTLDQLTGLYTYDCFLKEAQKTFIQAEQGQRFAVFYCDILHFRLLNDMYGTQEGNRQLQAFAHTLLHPSRAGLSTRVFSDLFIKLFPLKDEDTLASLSCQFEKNMERFILRQLPFHPECKLIICSGLANLEQNTQSGLLAAIDNANIARKRARELGRTCCISFNREMEQELKSRQNLSRDLQRALAKKEFIFYLQPKVNLRTGKVVGAEALARWLKPDGVIAGPNEFIPMMEKDGSIVNLDFLIYEKLADSLGKKIRNKEAVVPISLNVSREHLHDLTFAQKAHAIFSSRGVDPSLIEFELTENVLMDIPEETLSIISQLKKYGYKASVDDFGAGFSSLSLIAKLNVDVLKLDKSLLGNSEKEISNRRGAVLTSITEMARKLHLTVLCEGVETLEQAAYLNKIGCSLIQGFYAAPPLEPEALFTLLKQNHCYPFPWVVKNSAFSQTAAEYIALDSLDNGSLSAISNSIFHILPGGTIGIEPTAGKVLFVSDSMEELVGLPSETIAKQNMHDWYAAICTQENRSAFENDLINQLDSRGQIDCEFSLTRRDGITKWITMHAGYASSAEWGQYLLCFLFDDTKAHRNEQVLEKTMEQLQAERNFYRNLYDNVMCGIIRCRMNLRDDSFHTISVNQSAAHIFGFDSPEALLQMSGGNLCAFASEETRREIMTLLPTLQKKADSFRSRCHFSFPNGEEKWADCRFQMVQRSENNLIFQMIFLDCTDTVMQKGNCPDSLYEQAGCGLFVHKIEAAGKIACTQMNQEALRLLNLNSIEEYRKKYGQTPLISVCSQDHSTVKAAYREMKQKGNSVSFYHRIQLDNGQTKWLYTTEKQISSGDGIPTILSTMVECTERKQLELRLSQEKDQLALLYNSTSCGILQFTWEQGTIRLLNMNRQASALLGLEEKQQSNSPMVFYNIVSSDDRKNMRATVAALTKSGENRTIENRVTRPDGSQLYLESSYCLLYSEGNVKTVQCTLVDITQRKRLEDRLESSYRSISDLMRQSIFVLDYKKDLLQFHLKDKELNDIPERIDHFSERYKNGEFPDIAMGNLLIESVYTNCDINNWNNIEYKTKGRNGTAKWISCSFSLTRDGQGQPESGVGCLQDITANVLERQRLRRLSETDQLTGLLNKVTAEEKCCRYLRAHPKEKNALLILDLDNFKNTNDTNGHQFGDQVLQQFGKQLGSQFRKEDIIGRIGGDEFLVFLKNVKGEQAALNRAAAICRQMAQVAQEMNFPGLSCSIGIALSPEHGVDYPLLLRNADVALYKAKNAGKNQFCLYELTSDEKNKGL